MRVRGAPVAGHEAASPFGVPLNKVGTPSSATTPSDMVNAIAGKAVQTVQKATAEASAAIGAVGQPAVPRVVGEKSQRLVNEFERLAKADADGQAAAQEHAEQVVQVGQEVARRLDAFESREALAKEVPQLRTVDAVAKRGEEVSEKLYEFERLEAQAYEVPTLCTVERAIVSDNEITGTVKGFEKMEADAKKMPQLRSVDRVDIGESGIADTLYDYEKLEADARTMPAVAQCGPGGHLGKWNRGDAAGL